MSTAIIRLSHTLRSDDTVYPGNPKVEIHPKHQFSCGDNCNTFEVKFFNHNGTHIDFPNHYVKEGKSLNDYQMADLVFSKVYVMRLAKNEGEIISIQDLIPHKEALSKTEAFLLITGFQKHRSSAKAYANGPYLNRESAKWLRENAPNVKCIGLDLLSITSMSAVDEGQDVHRILLGGATAPFVIEDMNLAVLATQAKIKKLFIAPWFIEKLDGGPCTAFAEVES